MNVVAVSIRPIRAGLWTPGCCILPNGIVAFPKNPRPTSPMSSSPSKGTMLMGGLHKHHCGTGLSFRRIEQQQHVLLALPAQVTCSSRRPKAAELLMGDPFSFYGATLASWGVYS